MVIHGKGKMESGETMEGGRTGTELKTQLQRKSGTF